MTETPEKPGLEETIESFNGFDEIAIAQQFGKEVEDLSTFRSLRAAVYVLKRREGMADREAYAHAMDLPMQAVQGHFSDFDEDADRDPMVEESGPGKDDSPPAEPRMSSQP